jgi:hypothetical protein
MFNVNILVPAHAVDNHNEIALSRLLREPKGGFPSVRNAIPIE